MRRDPNDVRRYSNDIRPGPPAVWGGKNESKIRLLVESVAAIHLHARCGRWAARGPSRPSQGFQNQENGPLYYKKRGPYGMEINRLQNEGDLRATCRNSVQMSGTCLGDTPIGVGGRHPSTRTNMKCRHILPVEIYVAQVCVAKLFGWSLISFITYLKAACYGIHTLLKALWYSHGEYECFCVEGTRRQEPGT
jgi:hypothetical protein